MKTIAFVGLGAILLMVVNAAQAEAVLFSDGALDAAPSPINFSEAYTALQIKAPPVPAVTARARDTEDSQGIVPHSWAASRGGRRPG